MTTSTTTTAKFSPDERSNVLLYDLLALGWIPEHAIRVGIRLMLAEKLRSFRNWSVEEHEQQFVAELKSLPIAIATQKANQQHYEVPASFFEHVLGKYMKYSCALWEEGDDLDAASERMLALTCDRADIHTGQRVLDLGCGWGSFSLFAAKRFPNSEFIAFSNSHGQKVFIEARAKALGLQNLQVITGDVSQLLPETLGEPFDRVVSVEMFEHMKNYGLLLARISSIMRPNSKLFVHIFTHRLISYHFDEGQDWFARYFFAGGTMPSASLLAKFQQDLRLTNQWNISGINYEKTANAWLDNMRKHRQEILPILTATYGVGQTKRWWIYWRIFFMACAELWGFSSGSEWFVSHYVFEKL